MTWTRNSPRHRTPAIDAVATKYWKAYSAARDVMLQKTHTEIAPWTIVRADDKWETHLNVIRNLLARFEYGGKVRTHDLPDPNITFLFDKAALKKGLVSV